MHYKSYEEIPTDHMKKIKIQRRITLTSDMDSFISINDINLHCNSDYIDVSTVKIGPVFSENNSYYGPDFEGLALFYDGIETDEEFSQRKILWQKEKFKELDRADKALKKIEKDAEEKRKKLQRQIDELDRQTIAAQRERQRQMRSRLENKD